MHALPGGSGAVILACVRRSPLQELPCVLASALISSDMIHGRSQAASRWLAIVCTEDERDIHHQGWPRSPGRTLVLPRSRVASGLKLKRSAYCRQPLGSGERVQLVLQTSSPRAPAVQHVLVCMLSLPIATI
jgi:hypothetical protein